MPFGSALGDIEHGGDFLVSISVDRIEVKYLFADRRELIDDVQEVVEVDILRYMIHFIVGPREVLGGLAVIDMLAVMSLLGAELIDDAAEGDPGHPGLEGPTVIKLPQMLQYFEKGEIKPGPGFLFVPAVAKTNRHHVAIAKVVKTQLRFPVSSNTLLYELFVYCHTKYRKGH